MGTLPKRLQGRNELLVVHDGSCFDAIQAVVPSELENYASDVQRLTTGCSVEVRGNLIESQGKGQSVELEATEVTVVGWVDDPKPTPCSKNGTASSICASRLICERGPIPLEPWHGFGIVSLRPFTGIFTTGDSSGYTPRLSPPAIAKVQENCFACPPWMR